MAVLKWNPIEDLYDIQKDISRMFRRAFGATESLTDWLKAGRWLPALDVFSRDNNLIIRAEIPGVEPDQVDVSITDNTLTISGERKQEEKIEEKDVYMMESSYGKFRRSLSLPREVKPEEIKASFSNGILEVVIPQAAPEVKPKHVKVEIKKEKP